MSMSRTLGVAALLAAAVSAVSVVPDGRAQSVVSTGQSFVRAGLVPGAPGTDGKRLAGLRLSLADGWKTYWRSPGAAGLPPVFDWSGSRNLRSAEVLWPRPELFESFGTRTAGYSRQVVLPLRLMPEDPALPVELRLTAELGVCRELCVLERFTLDRVIAPDEADGAGQVAAAMGAVPAGAAASGLDSAHCRIVGAGPERRLEATLRFARPLIAPVVLVEGPESVWIDVPETRHEGGTVTLSAAVEMLEGAAWIDRRDLRLTVLDDGFAADVRGCTAPPD